MELGIIFCCVAVVVGFIYGLIQGAIRLNQYSQSKFGYMPVSFVNLMLIVAAYFICLVGGALSSAGDSSNFEVGLLIAGLLALAVGGRILARTSPSVAIGAMAILLTVGLIVFAGILLVLGALLLGRRRADHARSSSSSASRVR